MHKHYSGSTAIFLLFLLLLFNPSRIFSQPASIKVIAFYSSTVEKDHVDFARDAITFFKQLSLAKNFQFDTTTNWSDLNDQTLKQYQLVLWINEFPHNEAQRTAFEHYMNNGGAWLGFHVSAYNDPDTHWPWFVNFLGGAVFYSNSWPPLPVKLRINDRKHAVTRHMPPTFLSPINEWYKWKPSPRLNKDVKVLVTLDSSNYPLGKKDILYDGDIPVVWTNTRYRMLYMNMGHGDQIFTNKVQNTLITDALLWLAVKK